MHGVTQKHLRRTLHESNPHSRQLPIPQIQVNTLLSKPVMHCQLRKAFPSTFESPSRSNREHATKSLPWLKLTTWASTPAAQRRQPHAPWTVTIQCKMLTGLCFFANICSYGSKQVNNSCISILSHCASHTVTDIIKHHV
jgi:hypothetical protein